MTLYEVIEQNTNQSPTNQALQYFRYSQDYKEMLGCIHKVASGLSSVGIVKGDKVGICMPNTPELLHIFYGINQIGAVAVMLNPKSPKQELEKQIKMTGSKVVFFSQVAMAQITEILQAGEKDVLFVSVPIMKHLPWVIKFVLEKRLLPYLTGKQFQKKYTNGISYCKFLEKKQEVVIARDDQEDAVIIFSGGTNGTIKAVVHSSDSFNQSASACLETEMPLPQRVRMLGILPSFHIFGLTVAIHLPYTVGGSVNLVPFFNLGILTKILKKECPEFFPGVPTIFERLLSYKPFQKAAKKGKLNFQYFRHGFVGGDHLSEEVKSAFNKVVEDNHGNGYISMGYGMSECCPVSVNNRVTDLEKSVGQPFRGTQIKICKEDNEKEQPEGESGEIVIASTYLMSYGIDENGTVTRPIPDSQGILWYRTGDMGYYDQGVLYYECRKRRIIKVSGNTIFASAIERVLKESLSFAENIYVVPVNHKHRGQGTYVFFVTTEKYSSQQSLEMAIKSCQGRVVKYGIPVGACCIHPKEVPLTALGKIAWGILETRANETISK